MILDTLEPFEVNGGGDIVLTSVKKIKGTKEYNEYAERNNICQIKMALEECSSDDFVKQLKQECECVPFELIQLSKVCEMMF